MDIKNLEQEVEEAVDRIFELPTVRKTGCHEIARLLRDELSRNGYRTISVKDGVVSYDVDFLLERHDKNRGLDQELDFDEEPLVRTPLNVRTKRIAHSWCELGEMIVDYHHIIRATPHHVLEGLLIVNTKENLIGKADYVPNGREFLVFGKTYIYIPFWITKLRI